jgi:hypothetical protein
MTDSHYQGGHQTLPIRRPTEQDISIQCSEGELISNGETQRNTVMEMFGSRPNLTWSPPNIKFPNKPKVHEALRLTLLDPFSAEDKYASSRKLRAKI